MYNPHPKRKLLADMDKTQLLRMREEQDMSNSEIAAAVGCCDLTIRKLIGPMPKEMLKRKQRENGARNAVNRGRKSSEGGYSVERKMQSFMPKPQREEEPAREAVLAVKRGPVMLAGKFMDYVIPADGAVIEVEKEGRTLIQVPADSLEQFIAELQAIARNISEVKPMQFWG